MEGSVGDFARRPRGVGAALSVVWRGPDDDVRGPRRVAPVRAVPDGRRARRHGAVLPAARRGSASVPARAAPRVRAARRHLHASTRTSRPSPTRWVEHARATRHDDRAARPRAGQPRRRGRRATTATCCATSSRAGSRSSASTRRATSRRPRSGPGRPDPRASSSASRRLAESLLASRRARPTSSSPTTCCAHVPDLQRLRRRVRRCCWRRAGRLTHRVPAPPAPARGQPVRHDLPRALLVLHAPTRRRRLLARPRPARRRRRGAPDARRLAAGAGRATTTTRARRRRPWRRCSARERRRGLDDARGPSPVRRARRSDQARAARVPGRRRARPADGRRRTAPRARRTRCSTTAGSGPTCIAFTVDRNPYKHGRYTPGMRIPIQPPERARRRRGRTSIGSCPGTCATRSPRSSRRCAAAGARFVVPIPGVEVSSDGRAAAAFG